jgi:hypothetical protein
MGCDPGVQFTKWLLEVIFDIRKEDVAVFT